MWRLCRGAESKQARELALALALAQECASIPEIARAYERMASHRVAEARYEEAIAMARQAREMAEQLGLTDVISDALDTEAKAIRGRAGDWAMLMEAALESALSGGHEEQAGRAFARAYMWHCDDLRPEEAELLRGRIRLLRGARHRHVRRVFAGPAHCSSGAKRTLGRMHLARSRAPRSAQALPMESA
jgi:hypothetical protein